MRKKQLHVTLRRAYFKYMKVNEVDNALLQLFENFLESAPQLTLQCYIIVYKQPEEDLVASTSSGMIDLGLKWVRLTPYGTDWDF